MQKIDKDYETLRRALPKAEYQELDNDMLGQLLRTFNDPALKRADGDVFGRIYEYFLTQFADQKAHDGGEFFTPVVLVLQERFPDETHGVSIDANVLDAVVEDSQRYPYFVQLWGEALWKRRLTTGATRLTDAHAQEAQCDSHRPSNRLLPGSVH